MHWKFKSKLKIQKRVADCLEWIENSKIKIQNSKKSCESFRMDWEFKSQKSKFKIQNSKKHCWELVLGIQNSKFKKELMIVEFIIQKRA
jgi:hypothetical protein